MGRCQVGLIVGRAPAGYSAQQNHTHLETNGTLHVVEGKDALQEINIQLAHHGKTTGLLLRILQMYFWTGKYIVLDSGFCVLKALIELWKKGVFACALINKWQSLRIGVPGDAMQRRFD